MQKTTFSRTLICLIILFLTTWNISAQINNCIVYDDLTPSQQATNNHNNSLGLYFSTPANYELTPKKFKVHFWSLRHETIDTLGAHISYRMATDYVKRLNEIYAPYQICFVLDGNGILKSTSHMKGKSPSQLKAEGIIKGSYRDDAINIYVADSLASNASGLANYYSNSVAVKKKVIYYSGFLLAHEIAHALGIMHTIGDRNDVPNLPNGMGSLGSCEHVTRNPSDPNFNADSAGDYVVDTPADPGLRGDPSHQYYNIDANCNYMGNQNDCTGTPYQVDNVLIRNIMSYGSPDCKQDLTLGQAERIHYGIDNADPAIHSVKKALITSPDLSTFDLVVRNSPLDFGIEPDTVSTTFWQSPDIWVRTTNDNSEYHENPVYGNGNNYVKVRVVNKGCAPSDGQGKLKLYWTKGGTNLPMNAWHGNLYLNGIPMGGLIGEFDLPVLQSYEEYVFTFPWAVPNPGDYSDEPWHFCLMAKIESPNDQSLLPEDNGQYYHFLNTNNIALHNVSVINHEKKSGIIYVGNFDEAETNVKLKISRDRFYSPNVDLFTEAEVKFTFDNKLWDIWQTNGFEGNNIEFFGDRTVIVKEDTEILLSDFPANEFGLLNVKVNFLTEEYTDNIEFGFNVEHWDENTNTLMGGELYLINKNEREIFEADAYVANNTINAIPINEPAVYSWYDTNGILLHIGQNYTVKNANGTYLLEVVADYDGFKDMKEVNITNNSSLLYNIYPNPATNYVTIQYNQLNCINAYLMLVDISNNHTSNYILDTNDTSITLNTTSLTPGVYRIVLVCDNNLIESHNLKIQ